LGRIRVAIWENQTEDKKGVWYNVFPSRLYTTDGKWKDSTSYRDDEVPVLSKALDLAYAWTSWRRMKLERAARTAAK
jgi:hypothetical protein